MNLGTELALVTGAQGWLGLSLVESLVKGLPDCPDLAKPQAGLKIRCLVLPGQDATELKRIGGSSVEIVEGDLTQKADCDKFCQGTEGAILFHTAGVIHPRNVAEFYKINLNGTENVLDAAISSRVKRAVITSSNSPCGCNPRNDHLFDESSPYNPYMNYGRSKMQMEQAVKQRTESGKIETVVLRPPWFYGPNQPPRQTLFFQMIRDGKAPIVGSGENRRSMAYMDNLAQGHLRAAMTAHANGKTYWIADERPYTMNEIMDTIEKLLETEFDYKCAHKRMRLPGFAGEVAWLVDKTLQAAGLYHQKLHVLSEMNKTIACSVKKAGVEIGYAPTIALEEGMRRSIKWVHERYGRF